METDLAIAGCIDLEREPWSTIHWCCWGGEVEAADDEEAIPAAAEEESLLQWSEAEAEADIWHNNGGVEKEDVSSVVSIKERSSDDNTAAAALWHKIEDVEEEETLIEIEDEVEAAEAAEANLATK